MQAIAYRRARHLLGSQRDPVIARILGTIESLLIVALLGVVGLFVALMASRGEARFPADRIDRLPRMGGTPPVGRGSRCRALSTTRGSSP